MSIVSLIEPETIPYWAVDEQPLCGDVLAPIPGLRWECVAPSGHLPELEHIAADGTTW